MNDYKVEKQDDKFVVIPENSASVPVTANTGLTAREQFATAALTGLLASSRTTMMTSYTDIAQQAVSIADKLIQELNKKVL